MLSVQYGDRSIDFSVRRKERKTLEIAVEPDTTITVIAPVDASEDEITARVKKKAAWIRKQQRYFKQFLPRTPERKFVSGETHLYLGRQYRLKVIKHLHKRVKMERGFILVQSQRPSRADETKEMVTDWYKDKARNRFALQIEESLDRFPNSDEFRPNSVSVRHLKMRWGSMSPKRNLLLNWRLIQASADAIDYVITHELCHIQEPHHGSAFYDLLETVMPDWIDRKNKLERILA